MDGDGEGDYSLLHRQVDTAEGKGEERNALSGAQKRGEQDLLGERDCSGGGGRRRVLFALRSD